MNMPYDGVVSSMYETVLFEVGPYLTYLKVELVQSIFFLRTVLDPSVLIVYLDSALSMI